MTSLRSLAMRAICTGAGIVLAGCGESPAPPRGTASTPNAAAPAAPKRAAADDHSLTPAEYIEAGMPAHDRTWIGKDMSTTASLIARLAASKPGELPRYQSERSGPMFARIASPENLAFYRDKSLPIAQRLPDALDYMNGQNQITKTYVAVMQKSGTGGDELIELSGSSLRLVVVMLELTDEFVPTLDEKDPSWPTRMAGLKQMKQGFATMLAGALLTLSETGTYRSESLKRLIGYLDETLPALLPALPEGARAEAIVRLRSYAADPKMEALQPELGRLAKTAENAASPAKE